MTLITSIIPPQVVQHFSNILLSVPITKFGDDSERLKRIYLYIKYKLSKKCKDEIRKNKFKILEDQYLELYERAKAKEKELEEKNKNLLKEPFYYIEISDLRYKKIYRRLRYRYYLS